ncbi:MAG: type III polyketide synthase [Candidatus Omnitrophica bacterium]|nr:type III polyketide synthase [Candidatus Omnitrophota bacterium]
MNAKIINISTANPGFKLSQRESLDTLRHAKKLSRREDILYERFLSDKGIGYRYFSIDKIEDFFVEDQDLLIKRFQGSAERLSVASVEKCIKGSGISKDRIGCIVVSTCTGYLCPGLTSYIVEGAGLSPDIFALDIVGMGCGGAMPALEACHNYLNTHKDDYALAISTEICSSALFWGDDPELILSNSIFGDGSAACLLTNKAGVKGLRIMDFKSKIEPHHRDNLRLRTENSRLRNVIKDVVPEIASALVKEITHTLFERNELSREDVKFWAMHPGGRKVLDAIQAAMDLKEGDLDHSRKVLYDYGNMSSPTVLYVLRDILENSPLNTGDLVLMASFGAGFSGYEALLSYE